ncbi:MAG: hypothetical protein GC181_09165 [Bacteroidetes bacterium]|nr:hypothetical protein [Bacteroidota bacterium]
MHKYVFLLPLIFMFSCGGEKSHYINASDYSDIKSFFKSEVKYLDSLQPKLLKYSEWNGETSVDTLDSVDWNKELTLFRDLNIPLAVFRTEFERVDSQQTDGLIIRTFNTLRPEQEIRSLTLATLAETGELNRVEVEYRQKNQLSVVDRKMSYTRNKGYSVAGSRNSRMMSEENYKIVAQILRNQN